MNIISFHLYVCVPAPCQNKVCLAIDGNERNDSDEIRLEDRKRKGEKNIVLAIEYLHIFIFDQFHMLLYLYSYKHMQHAAVINGIQKHYGCIIIHFLQIVFLFTSFHLILHDFCVWNSAPKKKNERSYELTHIFIHVRKHIIYQIWKYVQ